MKSRDPYRIPPANALIAFENAARHANFTLAARELRTSQAAARRQIGKRETWLSARLFERSRAGATLTDAGVRFQDGVAAGLAAIHRGAAEAAELSNAGQVVIACSHETSVAVARRLPDGPRRDPDVRASASYVVNCMSGDGLNRFAVLVALREGASPPSLGSSDGAAPRAGQSWTRLRRRSGAHRHSGEPVAR